MLTESLEGVSNRAISRVILQRSENLLRPPELLRTFSVSLSLALRQPTGRPYDHGADHDANRSKFICCTLHAGLPTLGRRSPQRRNCRDQGRYDYQAGASARRGVEIRRRVADLMSVDSEDHLLLIRQLGRRNGRFRGVVAVPQTRSSVLDCPA